MVAKERKTLVITSGDVNGVGPEIALKAVSRHSWSAGTRFVLLGDHAVFEQVAHQLNLSVPLSWEPSVPWPSRRRVVIWSPASVRARLSPGKITAQAARLAMDWVRLAVDGCLNGTFDGMVTAPLCKAGLMKAGIDLPGHTEYLAQLTGTKRYAMMLMGKALRVVLVTRHLSLRDVPDALTKTAIREAVQLTAEALPWLQCPAGCIGVCALNPHAGDGGALGDEERRIISPALRKLKREGVSVEGPVPADVIFYQALKNRYDAVIAMYHDQGLGPLKMLSFEDGINITLGLPIIRTSPDHGTAFDIAGTGQANPASMIAAIKLALSLTSRPNPWRTLNQKSI